MKHTGSVLLRLAADLFHDLVFDLFGPDGGLAVIDHGATALVAAFGEDAAGGDVGHDVVAIAGHPGFDAALLGFGANGEIDDDFAAEEEPLEVAAELPELHRVGVGLAERFAGVDFFEEHLGSHGEVLVRVLRLHDEVVAGGQLREGEWDFFIFGG